MQLTEYEKELIEKIKKLEKPWCHFNLNEKFHEKIETQKDYDSHGVIRELIYSHYPDEPSISSEFLPSIISPMLWETVSNIPRTKIESFKYQGKPISEDRYERYKRQYRYFRKIIKIQIFNKAIYRNTLIKNFNMNNLAHTLRITNLNRRINALNIFENKIKNSEWPNLLLMISLELDNQNLDRSFTATNNYEVTLIRGEGAVSHFGTFYYNPMRDEYLKASWAKRWSTTLNCIKLRNDWPEELHAAENVSLYKEQIKIFNLNSINIIKDILIKLREQISIDLNKNESALYDVFLCHASADKEAIVEVFHNACIQNGIKSWFDKFEISWGDKIVEKINFGLANSRFVIIFISSVTLNKSWVKEELSAALTMSIEQEKKVILPILLGVKNNLLQKDYPFLLSRFHISIPIYDPNIKVNDEDIFKIIKKLKELLKNCN